MPGASTSGEQESLEKLSKSVAIELAGGMKKDKIVKELVKRNWTEDAAVQVVSAVERTINEYKNFPEVRKALAGKYSRKMMLGIIWAVGGTFVTLATYEAASGSGVYVIAWGAIVFGLVDFVIGLFGWMRYYTPDATGNGYAVSGLFDTAQPLSTPPSAVQRERKCSTCARIERLPGIFDRYACSLTGKKITDPVSETCNDWQEQTAQ